jgi:hypothetical protein
MPRVLHKEDRETTGGHVLKLKEVPTQKAKPTLKHVEPDRIVAAGGASAGTILAVVGITTGVQVFAIIGTAMLLLGVLHLSWSPTYPAE